MRRVRFPAWGDRWSVELTGPRLGRWVLAVLAALAVVLISLRVAAPAIAESRLQDRLAAHGLSWSSGSRSAGLGGLSFENVSIESVSTHTPVAQLGTLDIELSWLGALWNPRRAIHHIRAAGVDVDLTLDTLSKLYASRRPSGPAAAAPETSAAALPMLTLEGLRLKLVDADGPLLSADLPRVVLDRERWEAELARLELGSQAGEFALFEDTRASGPFRDRRPQLQTAQVGAATLVWSAPESDAENAPSPGLVRRIRRARAALRDGAEPKAADTTGRRSALWTPDARLELRDARVLEGPGMSGPAILEGLEVELLAEEGASVRVRGDGATSTRGSVSWDLHVAPADAKIEGRLALRAVPLALFAPVLPGLPFHELDRTRVAADLDITGRGLESASVRGELSISDLAFESERLASTPVGPISFTAHGQATWTPARRELSDLRGELALGAARVLVTGALAWPKGAYRVDLRAELPRVRCQAALGSVPFGVLEELSTMKLAGDIRAKVDVHVDSADLEETKIDFDFGDRCRFSDLPELMDVHRFEQPFTHHVLEPDGTTFEMETGPGTLAWTPIERISPFMIQAVVASEDARFFKHSGFAESQIGPALARNLQAGAFKFGASTITMQLVKNVFLHREKRLARKAQEALIVWWLEREVDKKWILELYLNVIEYGSGVYGIRNAAMHYFGAQPIDITPAQAAFLATVLPSPKSYDKQYSKGTISSSTKRRVASLLRHMRSRERIDDEALAYGLEELDHFEFHRPGQPLPEPPQVRGSAQAPPFQPGPVEGWSTYGVTSAEENVFYGGP